MLGITRVFQGAVGRGYMFAFRKYVNIRAQVAKINEKQGQKINNRQQNGQLTAGQQTQELKNATRFEISKEDEQKLQKIRISQKIHLQQRMDKQYHQLNWAIKNMTKTGDLFHLIRRCKRDIKIEQLLTAFDKLVSLDNEKIKKDQESILKNNTKFEQFLKQLYLVLDKTSYSPEIYIKFIDVASKTSNAYIFNYVYSRNLMSILNKELGLMNLPPASSQPQNLSSQQPQVSLSQVISINSSIKLLQCLLRLLNRHPLKPQDQKQLISISKSVITYIHTPLTPAQVNNHVFWTLVQQYISMSARIRVGYNLVKQLVKEGVHRLHIDKLREISRQCVKSGKLDQLPEVRIVNTLVKLIDLEKLCLQQQKNSTIFKEIMDSKENSLNYNHFNMTQHRITDLIGQFGKHFKFIARQKQVQQDLQLRQQLGKQGSNVHLWQHITLMIGYREHLRTIFTRLPIEVLGKCGLFQTLLPQYENACWYLVRVYKFMAESSRNEVIDNNHKLSLFSMLIQSSQLFHALIDPKIHSHLPQALAEKSFTRILLKFMVQKFIQLPKQTQIQCLHILLTRKTLQLHTRTLEQLISYLLTNKNGNICPPRIDYKTRYELLYVQLLMGDQKYRGFINESNSGAEWLLAKAACRTIMEEIGDKELSYFSGCDPCEIVDDVAKKISEHIKQEDKRKDLLAGLMVQYRKSSSVNSLLSQKALNQLKNLGKAQRTSINSSKDRVQQKINSTLSRAQLILKLVEKFESNELKKLEFYKQIAKSFAFERQTLNFQAQLSALNKQRQTHLQKILQPYSQK